MRKHFEKLWLAVPLLLLELAMPIWAEQTAQRIDVSRHNLERARQSVEGDHALEEQEKKEILKHYDEALAAASAAETSSALAARYQRDREGVPRLVESLEAQLQGVSRIEEVTVPDSAKAADVEQMVRQARAELAARREAVQSLQKARNQRADRRAAITQRTATLDQQIYELEASIESTSETANKPLMREAILASLAAQRWAAREEIAALNEEMANFEARGPLRLLREQRAQRRVVESIQRLSALEQILQTKTRAETQENLIRLRQDAEQALKSYPNLKGLTDEILQYGHELFSSEGIETKSGLLTTQLNAMRDANSRVAQVMQVARTKYEALGRSANIQRWYPLLPPEIPSQAQLQLEIRSRAIRLADAQVALVGLLDKRANLPDLDSDLARLLASLGPTNDSSEVARRESLCRSLLLTRKQLLDRLASAYSDYYSKLKDLDAASKEVLGELKRGYQFALERIYWRRSVIGPTLPSPSAVLDALRWLFFNPDWPESISRSFRSPNNRLGTLIADLILLVLLLARRTWLKQRLKDSGELTETSNRPALQLLKSAILTVLLAAPLPLAMAGLGLFLSSPEPALVAQQVGLALLSAAKVAFYLELITQIFRPRGFAEAELGWSAYQCSTIRREVRWLLLVLTPAWFLCTSFGIGAADQVGDPARTSYVESLGRIAFILGAGAVAVASFRIFRWLIRHRADVGTQLPGIALAILGAANVLGALLSLLGWHLTALTSLILVARSFLLVLVVVMVAAGIDRLRQLRRRLLLNSAARGPSKKPSESGTDSEDVAADDEMIGVESTNRQVSELIRVGATIILILGIYSIYAEQLSSLRFLERVQILPTARILPVDRTASEEAETAPVAAAVVAPVGMPAKTTVPASLRSPKLQDSDRADQPQAASVEWSLTVAGLFAAILIVVFTALLAKYIPSLFDFVILSRFRIASGDRSAIMTIIRYVLLIIGSSAAAAKLGLRWSQVQWLAAAFSFGLGFGLQDIFANFFSGLVLLFERPMRVGDFCRFGEQLGTVESIGLRSTRVRGLDRTLINVPNADFSKKELVNFASRDRFLLRTTVGLRYETTGDQLRFVLAKVRELLLSHPRINSDPARARFVGFGEYSLNIEIFAYGIAQDWNEFLAIQEDVYFRIMRIIRESGTGFAFPSRTLYMGPDERNDPELTAAAEKEVKIWRGEHRLPFPDFPKWQRHRFRDTLDFPPAGSPHARSFAEAEDKGAAGESGVPPPK